MRFTRKCVFGTTAVAYLVLICIPFLYTRQRGAAEKLTPTICCPTSPAPFNDMYPLSAPRRLDTNTVQYKLTCIADMDTMSPVPGDEKKFHTYLISVYVNVSRPSLTTPDAGHAALVHDTSRRNLDISVRVQESVKELVTTIGGSGRGAEMSDLTVYNGKVYTCDDRTGIVFEIYGNKLVPWIILADGDGRSTSMGFKCEWMTVIDKTLIVGGMGKEWTSKTGEFLNDNPMYVKTITHGGIIQHVNWRDKYNNLRKVLGYNSPGYVIHEAIQYSKIRRTWFILPRRVSEKKYDDKEDRLRGNNLLIETDANFSPINIVKIGNMNTTGLGFSSFKFIPGTGDEVIIAVRSLERSDNDMASFISVFDIQGKMYIEEMLLSNIIKIEGIEFI